MEHVDTERMKRVLGRLYPDRKPPPPPDRGEACALLRRELQLQAALRAAITRSRECRRVLGAVYDRSERRARRLRADCFLRRGESPPPPPPRRGGVITQLREIHAMLSALSDAYENASADGRRREDYRRGSRECKQDALRVRELIERALT